MRKIAGLLLLELSTIDPDGGGEYTDDLISRMQALKQSCQQEKSKCVAEHQPNIALVEDRLQFFIDVMTTSEEKYARQYNPRPPSAQETQMTDMLFTLKNLVVS